MKLLKKYPGLIYIIVFYIVLFALIFTMLQVAYGN
jgi:hypothetical protein